MSVTAGRTESPGGAMSPSSTVDVGWFVAFWNHQNFQCLKLIEIVILWVHYTVPLGFSMFWGITVQFFIRLFWLRITDEGSMPEMRIWAIRFKMVYIHLSRSLFLYLQRPGIFPFWQDASDPLIVTQSNLPSLCGPGHQWRRQPVPVIEDQMTRRGLDRNVR